MSAPAAKKATRGKKRAASPADDSAASAPAAVDTTTTAAKKKKAETAAAASAETTAAAPTRAKRSKKEATDSPATAVEPPAKRPARAVATAAAAAAAAPAAAAAAAASSSHELSATSLATQYIRKGQTGEVFSVGSGDCSQLGLGPDEEMRERQKPTKLKVFEKHSTSIIAVAAGSLHNLVLTKNHAIYSWGCNDDFALGRESDEWLPEPVSGPLGKGSLKGGIAVAQIACGASHSVALTEEGDVYAFGTFRDANGVIGFSETMEAAKEPTKLTFGTKSKIAMIAAGEHHDLALTVDGEVFQWGDIGIGRRFSDRKKKTKLTPSRVLFKKSGATPAPKKLVRVYAGGHCSYALDEHGQAWCFELGLKNPSPNDLMVLTPTPVPGLPPLAKIACATHHSLFLTRAGQVYSTGRGEDGRLGHDDMKNYEQPTLIQALASLPYGDVVVDVNCGECHSFCVTKEGRVYSFGYGDLLQLGNGVEEDVGVPTVVTAPEFDSLPHAHGRRVLQAAGGAQHSIFLAVKRKEKVPWAAELAAGASEAKVAKKAASPKKVTNLSSFLPTSGWECDACLVQNKDSAKVCEACETPRGGVGAPAPASGSVFGAGAAAGSSAPTTFGTPSFSFGAPADVAAAGGVSFCAAPAAAAGGFSFGGAAPAAVAAPAAAAGGFSFGGAAPAAGGFTFGASTDTAMKD